MTTYYSKGGTSGTHLDFQTPANWNTQADGGGSDASTLAGHDLILQSGDYMDFGDNVTTDSLNVLGGGHLAANSSYSLTLAGADGGNDVLIIDGYLDDNNLNIIITRSGSGNVALDAAASNNIRNLNINHGSCDVTLTETCTIGGDLTLTVGKITTGSGVEFTVT